jgi:hypothetical protein
MKKIQLGLLSGFVLGLLDGLSAFFVPEAQEMLGVIIPSATIKGIITGLVIGLIVRKVEGIVRNILIGGGIGAVLSALAAIPSGSYVEIIAPGILIGLLIGFIVSKWGQ